MVVIYVSVITIEDNYLTFQASVSRWEIVFIIAGVIYIIGALFYTIFGSGKHQDWDKGTKKSHNTRIYLPTDENESTYKSTKNEDCIS